ncbi:glucose-6-phosphate dehydrogenase assembly protein OpcA [Tessaracoccus palaemonis]|uniref:Glucose-6-phosphate dehydrogenase assembly protein OpcA n=1 Tax=Tessaracoccus palaemonis TaxID=2829499 RepID=A0ABX8SF03_9ACTN|nr:glucose-6-phosphate dehydrogenase assembly protein OpcA [Tessaracoccus palaemonis]QXT61981.1 glucose-6-phosphate dehydrogenase assembly protein OpcA [Tessaracoccus palaemonis]
MIVELKDTSARDIDEALLKGRRFVGTASGMVLTLLIVTDDAHFEEVLHAAKESATAHPSRVIVVTFVDDDDDARLDASIEVGEGIPGDLVVLRLHGGLRAHGDSVCLPLLLPDSPTIVWWPNEAPDNLSADPIGSLADRRITDASGSADPQAALVRRAGAHADGDTDLAWTRLTRWRALLAAAMDQTQLPVTSARVVSAPDNAPATLLAAWLSERLGLHVERLDGDMVGVNEVVLSTEEGDISVRRIDDITAVYQVPGEPRRSVALRRRSLPDLLTEELRRTDADEIFEAATQRVCRDSDGGC